MIKWTQDFFIFMWRFLCKVFTFIIQKSSVFFKRSKANSKLKLKLWCESLKFWSAQLYGDSLRLNSVSNFPMSWMRQSVHCIRFIKYLLLQRILYVMFEMLKTLLAAYTLLCSFEINLSMLTKFLPSVLFYTYCMCSKI